MNTNALMIIAVLVIGGLILNYWQLRKNSIILEYLNQHLKELRITNYPANQPKKKENIVFPEENNKSNIIKKNINQEINDIINYEVTSNDTAEIEQEIYKYEQELNKYNSDNDDIISNTNVSIKDLKDNIDSLKETNISIVHEDINNNNQNNLNELENDENIDEVVDSELDDLNQSNTNSKNSSLSDNILECTKSDKSIDNQKNILLDENISKQQSINYNNEESSIDIDKTSLKENTTKSLSNEIDSETKNSKILSDEEDTNNLLDKNTNKLNNDKSSNNVNIEKTNTRNNDNEKDLLLKKYTKKELEDICYKNGLKKKKKKYK